MHRVLGSIVPSSNQVTVELVSIEGGNRSHQTSYRDQAAVEGLVGGELIRSHLTGPEAAAREAHIPVTELLRDEVPDRTSGTCGLVVLKVAVHLEDEAIQRREDPAVDLGTLSVRKFLTSGRIEAV